MKTLPKADFIRLVQDVYHSKYGLKASVEESECMVDVVVSALAEALSQGQRVTLYKFGSFTPKLRPSRVVRNPRTKELNNVTASGGVKFHLSPMLSDRVKGGLSG